MAVESEEPPAPRAKVISDVLADTLRKTSDKFRYQQEAAPEKWPRTKKLGLAATTLGLIGAAYELQD